MVPDNLTIVCYTGGACGDLVTAMIDHRNCQFTPFHTVKHADDRQRLKKPHLFSSDEEKDQYLIDIAQQYNSIPSHDLDYHVRRGHKFISIVVDDNKIAHWAANRFKALHRPHVWEEMSRACGAKTVDDYAQILIHYSNMVRNHTTKTISLESIKKKTAVDSLEQALGKSIDQKGKNVYINWWNLQHGIV
jgi:hypothetical protein